MRAQVLGAYGGPENFALTEVPLPELTPGTVLVRIAAASVNQIDSKIRQGLPVGPALPAILGADLSGTVEAVGPGVVSFHPGDEVYGLVGGVKGLGGTLAEYIACDERLLAPRPKSVSLYDAAALPLVAITAWEALERARVSPGEHVLVHGGTGGVGHIGIQLAKSRGARVATTVGADEDAIVARKLGADETINFREESVENYVTRLTAGNGFDVVFDTVGGVNLTNSFAAAKTGGRVVTTNSRVTLDLGPMHGKALTLSVVFIMLPLLTGHGREVQGRILRDLANLVDARSVRPLIDPTVFTLETAPDAHRYLDSGKARGKVIVRIA